jgi:DNA-binding NtrC family response regulator
MCNSAQTLTNHSMVFVVDDENVIASTLELILTSQGLDARYFANPLDALKVAGSASPDLLFTDVVMPQMNGIELAVQIKQLCPDYKILLSSGQMETTMLREDASSRGHHFEILAKHVQPKHLFETIQRLFDANSKRLHAAL